MVCYKGLKLISLAFAGVTGKLKLKKFVGEEL